MRFCVCQNKETGELTVLSRAEREVMIGALRGVDFINSRVIKECETQEEAFVYMKSIRDIDNLLEDVL